MADPNRNQDRVVVTFFSEAVLNQPKSEASGRPIFDDVEMIMFQFAGDTRRVCAFPATETDPNATREAGYPVSYAEAHAEAYRKFKAGQQQTVAGTALSEAPFLTEAKRRELRALNIHSVEALAALDGPNLKTLGIGGRELKNQARAYLDKAAGSADVTGMAAQIATLRENMQLLMDENARLVDQMRGGAAAPARPADSAQEDGAGEGGDDPGKAIEECSDAELRDFIAQNGGKVAHNAGRARLLELATELAQKGSEAA